MTTYSTDSQGKFIPATQRPDGTWRKPRRVREGYVPQEEVPLYESKGKQFAQKPALPPGLSLEVVQKAKEKRDREKLRQQREEQQKKEQNAKRLQNATPVTGGHAADSGGNGEKEKPATTGPKNPNAVGRSKKTPELPDILLDQQRPAAAKPKAQPQQHAKSSSQQKPETSSQTDATNAVNELTTALATGAQLKNQPEPTVDGVTTTDAQQLELSKKLRKLRKKIREIEAIEVKLRSGDGPKLDKDQLEKVKRKPEILQEIEELEVQYSAGAM